MHLVETISIHGLTEGCHFGDLYKVGFRQESFMHVKSCTWVTTLGFYLPDGTAWTLTMTVEHSVYSMHFLCMTWTCSPHILTHLAGVVTMTFCQFTPSQGFKPIVWDPDSQKAGTVGGLHNTSLSSLASGTIFVEQRTAHRKQWTCHTIWPCLTYIIGLKSNQCKFCGHRFFTKKYIC